MNKALAISSHNTQEILNRVSFLKTKLIAIKTHGSESRGQEEAACTRVFWPTRPLQ